MSIRTIKRYLSIFELNGSTILGMMSLAIISLMCYTTLTGKDLPSGVVTAYSIAVGAFALHKSVRFFKEKK